MASSTLGPVTTPTILLDFDEKMAMDLPSRLRE
jgi:hypothetical protein